MRNDNVEYFCDVCGEFKKCKVRPLPSKNNKRGCLDIVCPFCKVIIVTLRILEKKTNE